MSTGSYAGSCSVHQAARYTIAELNKMITSSLEVKKSCLKCNRYYVVQLTVKNIDHGQAAFTPEVLLSVSQFIQFRLWIHDIPPPPPQDIVELYFAQWSSKMVRTCPWSAWDDTWTVDTLHFYIYIYSPHFYWNRSLQIWLRLLHYFLMISSTSALNIHPIILSSTAAASLDLVHYWPFFLQHCTTCHPANTTTQVISDCWSCQLMQPRTFPSWPLS